MACCCVQLFADLKTNQHKFIFAGVRFIHYCFTIRNHSALPLVSLRFYLLNQQHLGLKSSTMSQYLMLNLTNK